MAQSAAELPTVSVSPHERVEVPIRAVYLTDTDRGDLLEATCPGCLNGQIIEAVSGRCLDYRCGCGEILRVIG